MASKFSECPEAPPIAVFALTAKCRADSHPNKVDLGVGAYRTDDSVPWVLPVVRQVEQELAADDSLNHEYFPVLGQNSFTDACCRLLVGDGHALFDQKRIFGVRSLGGTGALRLGAEFLRRYGNARIVYVSNPTWGNHKTIFKYAHFDEIREYRYWDNANRCLDIDGLLEDLRAAPEGAVVVLHAVAHNPTGMDPTHEQWVLIQEVVKERRLFTFFDNAYQGFASGDVDKDAWAVRYFVSCGMELFCAQSYSKNFGLYNERVGNLCVVLNEPGLLPAVKSQLSIIVRTMYSNPAAHGGRIVATVLNSPQMRAEWNKEIKVMADRIADMRQLLYKRLKELGTPGTWEHIVQQIGMFSFTGLNARQVDHLISKYHVYLMQSGRISMAAVTTKNVDYIAQAIHDAVSNVE